MMNTKSFDAETASYNMNLLLRAGPIEGKCSAMTVGIPLSCVALAMTWDGHELLDKMRLATD
jgi:hypothetical protein